MSIAISQLQDSFKKAAQLVSENEYEAASGIYLSLVQSSNNQPSVVSLALYRLAQISNITGDPLTAKDLYYQALALNPKLCSSILGVDHPNHGYVFPGIKEEIPLTACPLCGRPGEARWCYLMLEMGAAYVQEYNPVRVWMRCDTCNHMYAGEFPEQKTQKASGTIQKPAAMKTNTGLFSYYSTVLNRLAEYTKGGEFLEIGIGGSEFSLVAQEMGFHVLGIDISEDNVLQARQYGLEAVHNDFMCFETERKWDMIILGDVIEHVSSPVQAMQAVHRLLDDDGVAWISTPNFEAAYAVAAGHKDAMRRVASHKNYFSRESFFKLLEQSGFIPVEYRISDHYNGSMEIVAVKQAE